MSELGGLEPVDLSTIWRDEVFRRRRKQLVVQDWTAELEPGGEESAEVA